MKKQTRRWKRIMAVALAVLIAGSTVEPSALKVAAAGSDVYKRQEAGSGDDGI